MANNKQKWCEELKVDELEMVARDFQVSLRDRVTAREMGTLSGQDTASCRHCSEV